MKYPRRNPPDQLGYHFTEARRSHKLATSLPIASPLRSILAGSNATSFLRSFGIGLPQADARATAVFVDELDAGGF